MRIKKPVIYIAHPYSSDPGANYLKSLYVAVNILRLGGIPINPLESHVYNEIESHDYEFWMQNDFNIIKKCDAVYRVSGHSEGADREVLFADDNDIPVIKTDQALLKFIEEFNK